jgi:hypothetical protein
MKTFIATFAILLGLLPAAALAGQDQSITTKKGHVAFEAHGEWLWACDTDYDGLGVRAYLRIGTSKQWQVTDYSSYGGRTLCETRNLDIAEGTTVYLQMCYTQDKKDVMCSGTQKAVA